MGSLAITRPVLPEDIESVLVTGDLSKLTPVQRVSYFKAVCDSVGLNPLTKPFDYLQLNGKTVLYAKKDCTDQLRSIHTVSVIIVSREVTEGVYVVTARATMPNGRTDESIGAVPLVTAPEAKANCIMKAETKAKRRVTLSICGLGLLDESELDTIPPAAIRHIPEERGSVEAAQEVAAEKIEVLKARKPKTDAPEDPPALVAWLEAAKAPVNRQDVHARMGAELSALIGRDMAKDCWASANEGNPKWDVVIRRLFKAIQDSQPPEGV